MNKYQDSYLIFSVVLLPFTTMNIQTLSMIQHLQIHSHYLCSKGSMYNSHLTLLAMFLCIVWACTPQRNVCMLFIFGHKIDNKIICVIQALVHVHFDAMQKSCP